MLEITPEHIADLGDADLRTLIGRLCEAELATRGLPVSSVTWGGDQRAADGGLDVRVALPGNAPAGDFVPRPNTGFQVKCEDMPRGEILTEITREAGSRGEIRTTILSNPKVDDRVDDEFVITLPL